MPLCAEVDNVLGLIDRVQSRVSVGRQDANFEGRVLTQVNNDINTLLSVLKNPVFRRMCKIQDTVNELGNTLARHPSVTSNDFDITPEGNLILKITPPTERFRPPFDTTPLPPIPTSKSVHVSKNIEEPPPSPPTPITTPPYAQEFERILQKASQGRILHSIRLFKTEGSSLGFSVVGLKSQEKGELGIFVQEIQPNGIAARDGALRISDQILAIDGQPLDSAITHQQAIGILQQTRGEVEIVVARAPETFIPTQSLPLGEPLGVGQQPPAGQTCPSSPPLDTKPAEMVLSTEWAEVEVVELINDGTGLGFGIIGGRSTGVVVKTILPGGVADRCGRLQSGDHILQIGDVNLVGMGSEQVAAVLRQCGNFVRLVVARPVEPSSPDLINSPVPIVPTKILGDPEELERHLMQANGYGNHLRDGSIDTAQMRFHGMVDDGCRTTSATFDALPEVEIVDVELKKDSQGLGITIAGYVCEKEELSGIFIKSISEGSAADVSGKIAINDRIVEVDGQSLQGYTNHQAVEVLRQTGPMVSLKLERYHHGSKYEQLQSAISHSEHKPPTPSSVSALSLPQVPVDSDGDSEDILETGIYETDEPAVEARNADMDLEDLEMLIDTRYDGEILATVEAAIMAKWSKIMGPECDIVVAQLSKAKNGGGLGISLEGTVDVEDGREVRPHHYIRSILPDGPVGRSQKLLSGDELLEVNGRRLLGLNHVEVVGILKDLPMNVRIVCARRPGQPPPSRPIDTSQDRSAFAARNILGGSLQNLFQGSDRMVKAKSDGSLASTTTAATDTSLSKLKSRSLEPLSGLAMWSSEPHIIELPKGDRGLGFSILDYQDPMNPSETVIVIRSLVPGGVAQQDQRLIPGDRLLAVNEINLENASLDQAVQALKGAPKGIVRIVVAKPLPLPDTSTVSPTQSFEETPPPPLPASPPPEQISAHMDEKYDKPRIEEEQNAEQIQINSMIVPVATERLITTNRNESIDIPPKGAIPPLPSALERTIKIQKKEEQLGINVEVVDGGVNGLIVTAIAQTGAVPDDGRVQVGDFIVAVNNEVLRNTTNAQARAILRRAQLLSKELSLTYIPSSDAEVHKETFLIQQSLGERDSKAENRRGSSGRTPADGEESEIKPTVSIPVDQRLADKKSPESNQTSTASVSVTSVPPPMKISETSTLFISTGRGITSTATRAEPQTYSAQLPQIQKRVVTHVTIFPSPATVDSTKQIAFPSANVPDTKLVQDTKVRRNDSVDEDSSKKDSTVRRQDSVPSNTSAKSSSGEDGALLLAKHWGPERLVELHKEPNKSLGISIVGGKVDLYNAGHDGGSTSAISGIFIKNVLVNSPAGRTGQLKTGDRILAVDSIDLRSASHERAVEVIRAAGNPVKFLVQSLVQWSEAVGISTEDSETSKSEDTDTVTKSQSQAQHSGSQSQHSGSQSHSQSQSQSQSTTTSSQSKSGTGTSTTSTSSTSKSQTRNDAESSSSSSSSTESEKVTQKREGESVEESEENEEFDDDPFARAEDEVKKSSPVPKPSTPQTLEPPDPEEEINQTDDILPSTGGQTVESKNESDSSTEKHSSEEADELGCDQPLQGKIRTKAGIEIDRASAGNMRLSKSATADETEDEFGYTTKKIEKKWGELIRNAEEEGYSASLIVEEIDRGPYGLGISLAGHKNRLKMAVFIVGLNPDGAANKTKTLQVGDEILEVNGIVLHSRSHLNASALIKSLPHGRVKIIALRKSSAMDDMSVKPVVQFPAQFPLDQEKLEEKFSISKFPGVRLVTLKKTEAGLGIMIMEGRHAELGRGIFVSDIQESSIAEQAGLLVGDLILSVNQEEILGCDYDHAASVLKKTEGNVQLVVCNAARTPEKGIDRGLDLLKLEDDRTDKPKLPPKPSKIPSPSKFTSILSTLRKSSSPTEPTSAMISPESLPVVKPATPSPKMLPVASASLNISPASSVSRMTTSQRSYESTGDPLTCEIIPGKETTIEINKDRGLGISILGGQDTLLGSIIIQEVYPDGAAFKDGRLRPGDQLLFVNNEDFQNITHSCALAALRQTPNRIKMVVLRDDDVCKEDDLYEIYEVELTKKHGKGLGLSIVSRKNGNGVFISDVVPGGQAESDGRLIKGDRILTVNGKDLKESSQEEAASVLKTAMGTIHMKIGRFRTAVNKRLSSSNSGLLSEISSEAISDSTEDLFSSLPTSEIFCPTSENVGSPQLRTVILERENDFSPGLGFSLVGGFGSPHGDLPIYVKSVFEEGAAFNKLNRGDQIVAVNQFSLEGLTHQEVVTILKQSKGNVTLSILS